MPLVLGARGAAAAPVPPAPRRCPAGPGSAAVRLVTKGMRGGKANVYVRLNGQDLKLTHFAPWERIRETRVDPSGTYGYVWHRPDRGPALLLTLYCLATRQVVAERAPGFGGDLAWNHLGQLVHRWGCGTSCENLMVYDVGLRPRLYTLSSGGFVLSPKRRYLVQLSMLGEEAWLFDLASLQRSTQPAGAALSPALGCPGRRGGAAGQGARLTIKQLTVDDQGRLRVRTTCGSTPRTHALHVARLGLAPLDPKRTGQFYLRPMPRPRRPPPRPPTRR